MAERHLNDLEKRLNAAHWHVKKRVDRTDFSEPAFWEVARADGSGVFRIEFPAMPDLDRQSIADTCGARCGDVEIYFARGRSWAWELDRFMAQIDAQLSPQSFDVKE